MSIPIAVLVSGGGTTLVNLADTIRAGRLDARIVAVVASRDGIAALERARQAGVEPVVVSRKDHDNGQAFSARHRSCCFRLP